MKWLSTLVLLGMYSIGAHAQQFAEDSTVSNRTLDSLAIWEVEDARHPDKVLHAEPLYIDLIRDLGARKGEREWNIGLGLTDNLNYDTYQALIEYEFAPADRLGLEIELPMTFYMTNGIDTQNQNRQKPDNRLESLKLAAQWSFFVSERLQTSMAIGYINELELTDLKRLGQQGMIEGNVFNPFFVAARRWGQNFHTLVYTGPKFERSFRHHHWKRSFEINSNLHYMIPGTRNFLGLEINKAISGHTMHTVMRPQLRVGVADNLLVGIVAGIPTQRDTERLSSFIRLIYEPRHSPTVLH
ncbi:phosphoribosylformylglycinamidine synthase [Fibrisoma montanum]|uniref:Phosphoribosylformylglycinamidine synthase n=1 Tax=Fibrisoma montanum TaxID=2305895 RepID=A0A418MK33_9BACT|nr:HAEPLYID family protein [Fibrisoma montanum]RIV27858.1 phosphoribosylformylglycinamidine synthase [Fibrisoma montanum]